MVTIGIDQLLSNSAIYKHKFMENIIKLYTYAGKWNDQEHYKAIIVLTLLSTPERFTDNNPISPGSSVTVQNTIARKSLHLFNEVLDVKKKTAIRQVGPAKSKRKLTRTISVLWSIIRKKSPYKNQWTD